MKWRRCVPCAAILSKRSTSASTIPTVDHLLSKQLNHPAMERKDNDGLAARSLHSDTTMKIDANPDAIGGGAINEKPRLYGQLDNGTSPIDGGVDTNADNSWDPSNNLSHLLHGLVGLDRYPNYLSRFQSTASMEALERALEEKLAYVRKQQSEIVQRRAGIHEIVKKYLSDTDARAPTGSTDSVNCAALWRNHPLAPPTTWTDLREKNVLQEGAFKVAYHSMASATQKRRAKSHKSRKQKPDEVGQATLGGIITGRDNVELDPSLLESWMSQEMFDVYSFPLLTAEFCSLLRNTLRELSKLAESDEFSHLQLGRRPIDLDTVGLGWITDLLLNLYIRPISKHLFAATEQLVDSDDARVDAESDSSQYLDWRQGYVAGYSAQPTESKGATRHRLVPHTDDAEVTLNCCLGEETFIGGNVEFYGLRGTLEEGQLVGKAMRPNVGTALLHAGRHLHAVSDVSSGDRYALIIWSRSWGRLRKRSCPCCWLNRRQDSTCICDKRWN